MNEVHVRVNERGFHVPYRRVNGVYAMDIGPAFRTPREAVDYATKLEAAPSVSPLRSGVALTDPSGPPGQASALVGVTPERRESIDRTSAPGK